MSGAPSTTTPTPTLEGSYVTKITWTDGNPIYVGIAPTGKATSYACWQIKKITWTSGNPTSIDWANGEEKFDKVWDDRATYSYS